MIQLSPFESKNEHQSYCNAALVPLEEGAIGFKMFKDDEKMGLCQLKFVGDTVYVVNLCAVEERISVEMLANIFTSIIEFLKQIQTKSIIYPILGENDVTIAEAVGFDRVSDTMYVFDFPENGEHKDEEHHCDCGCDHHHH